MDNKTENIAELKEVTWMPVKSSNVLSVGKGFVCNPLEGFPALLVKYHSDPTLIYAYISVETLETGHWDTRDTDHFNELFNDILEADSVGKYINTRVKGDSGLDFVKIRIEEDGTTVFEN